MAEELEISKSAFMDKFAQLRPDLAWPEAWSDEKKATAAEMVRPQKVRTSLFASIPLVCKGEKCIFASICPLLKKNLAPTGFPCPLEAAACNEFMQQYMEELQVDPDNLIEVSMVRDLVDQEIQYQRKTWLLSMEHFIQDNVMGVDREGNPIFTKQLHLASELEDRLHRRKRDLRNQLLATREARAKAGQGRLDTAQAISHMMDQVREIDKAKEQLLQKRLGLTDRDAYIDESIIEDAEVIEES